MLNKQVSLPFLSIALIFFSPDFFIFRPFPFVRFLFVLISKIIVFLSANKKDTRKSVFSFLLLSSTIRTSSISYKEQIHTFILTICKNIIFCYRYFITHKSFFSISVKFNFCFLPFTLLIAIVKAPVLHSIRKI